MFEETRTELINGSWDRIIKRVKTQKIRPTYLGVTKDGKILFKTTSGTTPGKYWHQELYFKDLGVGLQMLQEDPKLTHKSIISLLNTGNLLVHCNDLSFKYWGFQYIGTKRGYSLKRETRFPKKRNPRLTGAVCKHLVAVLQVLPFYTNQIVRDFRLKGILDPDWNKKRRDLLKGK